MDRLARLALWIEERFSIRWRKPSWQRWEKAILHAVPGMVSSRSRKYTMPIRFDVKEGSDSDKPPLFRTTKSSIHRMP